MKCPGCGRELTTNDVVAENETEKRIHCIVCDYEGKFQKPKADVKDRK